MPLATPRLNTRNRESYWLSRPLVTGGNGPAKQPLNCHQPGLFVTVAKADRYSSLAGPAGATDAVDVGFRLVRQFIVDHVGDLIDVDAAGGDVGGNQHRWLR
jgi:hypothetical protein